MVMPCIDHQLETITNFYDAVVSFAENVFAPKGNILSIQQNEEREKKEMRNKTEKSPAVSFVNKSIEFQRPKLASCVHCGTTMKYGSKQLFFAIHFPV